MKLKFALATASILFLTQAALAFEGPERNEDGPRPGPGFEHHRPHIDPLVIQALIGDGKGPKEGPCADVKLDKAQKAAIKDAYFKFKEANIDLETSMKKADLAREKVEFDEKSTFDQAEAASKTKHEAINALMTAHDSFRNAVEYKILKAEQRGPARACFMMHKFGRGPAGLHGRAQHKRWEGKKDQK